MLTARDRMIIKHIEQYGFITNRQARELFFGRASVKAYEVARRRIKAILDSKIGFTKKEKPLLTGQNKLTGENVFYYGKPPTYHDLQIMNVYSGLVFLGIEVTMFKKHAEWLGGKYISDAFIAYKDGDINNIACLEVCHTNNDTHLKGYEELHGTNDLQLKFNGAFPKIVLVGHSGKIPDTFLKVIDVHEDLSNLHTILR